jgi:hypothetical protein
LIQTGCTIDRSPALMQMSGGQLILGGLVIVPVVYRSIT